MSEKWKAVFENEELIKKVVALSPEDAQKVLAENGYEFSMDEIMEQGKAINEMLAKIEAGEIGELSEDDLDGVSGGGDHGGMLLAGIAIGLIIASCGW